MLRKVILSNKLAFVLSFSEYGIMFFADHGYLVKENGAIYTVVTPYKAEDINDLQFTQNSDVLYIFHPKYKPKTLSRYGNLDWRLEDLEFKNGPWDKVNTSDITMKISRTTQYARVTASDDVFKETDVGRLIRLTVKDSNKNAWQVEKDGISNGQILYSDNKYYRAKSSGKTGTVKPVHSEGTVSDGNILFEYVHSGYGEGKITQYYSPTEVDISINGEMPDALISKPTDYWELGLLRTGIDNPICGTFYRNRFCFMVKNNNIPYVCLSCSDDYGNFADKDNGQVLATNAITVPVTSDKYNDGRWLCSSDVLFVGTSSGEFYIDSASSSEAIGPDNVKIQQISEIGSKAIPPVKIGSHLLFVERNGTAIRDIVYSFASDAYDPVDLSLFGKHLLSSGITNMEYQESPDKIIWFTVEDGRLVGITFSSEQNVSAFHQHKLGGKVKDITVIPNPEANLDDLWVGVDRDGIYSVEWLDNGIVTEYPDYVSYISDYDKKKQAEAQYMKDNAFFVDGGLSIDREVQNGEKSKIKLDGLYHLEGKEVAIMVDGAERERQVVENGSIEIWNTDKHITGGRSVVSAFIPQTLFIQGNNGAGVGDVQRIDHVTLMLWNSLGGKVGSNFSNMQDIYFRKTDDKMNESAPLYTGNKTVMTSFNTSTIKEKGASIVIYNDSVFPMNILAIAPHLSTSGNGF